MKNINKMDIVLVALLMLVLPLLAACGGDGDDETREAPGVQPNPTIESPSEESPELTHEPTLTPTPTPHKKPTITPSPAPTSTPTATPRRTITGPPLAETAWPMFHHDLQHTGRSVYEGPMQPGLKWRYETGGMVISSPAIGGGW